MRAATGIELLRAARRLLLIPVAAILFYLAAGIAGALLPGAVTPPPSGAPGPPQAVGLLAGPIHVDFLLPLTPGVRETFAFAVAGGVPVDDPRAEWLIAGWGARGFYTGTEDSGDLRLGPLWTAATGDAGVLRLDVAGPVTGAEGITWIALSPAELEALAAAVAGTTTGGPALEEAGFTATDAFFPAQGRFHAFRTCNVWVGEMLRAAGRDFGLWTPTTWTVRLSLWRFGGVAPAP